MHFIPFFGYPIADTAFLQKIIINNKSKNNAEIDKNFNVKNKYFYIKYIII